MRVVLRTLLILATVLVWLVVVLFLSVRAITHGPSEEGRNLFVTTMLETGQMKWVVGLFLNQDEISGIVNENSMVAMDEDSDSSLISVGQDSDAADGTEPIQVDKIAGDNFSATMMVIKDPSRVFVGTTHPWGDVGTELDKLVEKYGAIAGTNGGLYESTGNSGGWPHGPVVSGGEIQNMAQLNLEGLVLIGLSEDNILQIIDINGKDETQIREIIANERIRDAVCFQEEFSDANNHFVKLIINGERREMNGLGSGANPRTAIGQTADGKILLLVTDGRGSNGHLGATAADLIDIFEQYGAVNAANLDGGSSSAMYYNGEYLRTSVTLYYSTSSWRIPTAILVKPEE